MHTDSSPRRGAPWLPMLLAAVAAGAAPVQEPLGTPASADTPAGAVHALLARRSGPDALPRPELVAQLVALGQQEIPQLVDVLLGTERAPALAGDLAAAGRGAEDLVLEALRAWPRPLVVTAVEQRLDAESPLAQRVAALSLLGRLGGAGLVAPVLDVLRDIEPLHLRQRYLAGQATDALEAAIAADDRAHSTLRARLWELDPALSACVARALARAGRARDVELLVTMLGRADALDEVVLVELARVPCRSIAPGTQLGAGRVRAFVYGDDRRLRKLAVLCLGRLHDAESFETLIDLLDDDDAGVAGAALWSLRTLSGLRWSQEPERWRAWLGQERDWLEEQAPRLAGDLAGSDASRAVRACRDLGAHRLFRENVVDHLLRGLDSSEQSVVRATCAALGRVGALSAAPQLIELLESADATVREAAQATLEGLTGARLGEETEAWLAWLEG